MKLRLKVEGHDSFLPNDLSPDGCQTFDDLDKAIEYCRECINRNTGIYYDTEDPEDGHPGSVLVYAFICRPVDGLSELAEEMLNHSVMPNKRYQVCEVCGSNDVDHKVWMKINDPSTYSGDAPDDNDTWCNNCQQHYGIESFN